MDLMTNYTMLSNTTRPPDLIESLLRGVMYGSMAVVVTFINVMVIISYALRDKKNRGILDMFMVSFAVSSILTSIFVIGLVAYVRMTHSERFIGKDTECYVQYFFGTMLRLTDVATTTGIAADRFLAVYLPMFYRNNVTLRHGYIACGVVWLSSALIATLPIVLGHKINKEMDSLCTADWTKEIAVVVLTVAYCQFLIVLVCYIGIFNGIRAFVKRQKKMLRPYTHSHQIVERPDSKPERLSDRCTVASEDTFSSSSCLSSRPCSPLVSYVNESFGTDFTDKLVQMSQRNMVAAVNKDALLNNLDKSFETEITDKLVKLSHSNMKTALREVKVPVSIELSTIMKVRTKQTDLHGKKLPSSKTSINLRMKADINKVSFIDQLHDDHTHPRRVVIQGVRSFKGDLHRERFHIEQKKNSKSNERNDIFLSDVKMKKTSEKQSKNKILQRSLGSVRDKWKARKVRRSSSMRHFWKESQHFAKIMGVVVLLFYVSWLPLAATINIVLLHGDQTKYHDTLWICYNLSLISSVAIPIAYAVMCKPYREAYKRMWRCVSCRCCDE